MRKERTGCQNYRSISSICASIIIGNYNINYLRLTKFNFFNPPIYNIQMQQANTHQKLTPTHTHTSTPLKGQQAHSANGVTLTAHSERSDSRSEEAVKGKKRVWTKDEDKLLRATVAVRGARDWSTIALSFEGRGGKQCRERWHNHLREGVMKQEWTGREEWLLTLGVMAFGNRWSTISRFLPGRPDNSIKNRWNCKMKPKKAALMLRAERLLASYDHVKLSEAESTEHMLLGLILSRQIHECGHMFEVLENCRKALIDFYRAQSETEVQPDQ